MALKDIFNRGLSYFETDEASELEDFEEPQASVAQPVKETPVREQMQTQQPSPQATRPQMQAVRPQTVSATARTQEDTRRSQPSPQERLASQQENVTIAIKYPKKYEDATEIVDLLIANECVLIDFQYMLDAQARRCLDFIDGASRVLYGNLQKVSSSMYLLTPSNVVVEAEDINLAHNAHQDFNFDYDMKRR